ncbi:unnamed protein product [Dracunculus medinensis]|uniref:Large ribosomal subunit protein bL17m n=1 Tax=Dracunculus medinensis TaxID=318479 RepID=A0A0N4UIB5_DRAME|nr:unnamed protein product [Dracunculus medinensis]
MSAKSLPKIRATIGHIPQRLKMPLLPNPRGRLEILRRMVTRLIREERCEFSHNRAVEVRPYFERLIHLGIYRGFDDIYTKEMMEWWITEGDLKEKMSDVIVPRLRELDSPYTLLYRLPSLSLQSRIFKRNSYYRYYDIGVLEIKGNPFPPVILEREDYSGSLLNILLKNALKKRLDELKEISTPH